MGERTQRNLTTKVRYFVYYDFTTLNGANSFMKSPQFVIWKYFEDLKMFRRPCSWFELTSRSWNFSKIEIINNKARHNLINAKCRWRSDQLYGPGSFWEPLGQTKVMQIHQRETQIRQRETTYEFCCLAAQWNFSEIANPLGFSPQPARPLCFLHASLHYSAGSLASLILPKKVQNLTPREVSTAMYRLY